MEQALNIWADMYNKADRERFNLMLENGKLKQTLKEIKGIAEKVKGYDPLAKQILQKCEVENEQN